MSNCNSIQVVWLFIFFATFFRLDVSIAFRGTFIFLFVITAADVVPCGGPYIIHSADFIFCL